MGIFGGLLDVAKNVGKAALAPVQGLGKVVATGLETQGKVLNDLLHLDGGKAIDDLGKGFHKQVDNVVGVPKAQWSALKGEVGGLGETLSSGAKFIGEPIRGVARLGANELSTVGGAAGQALNGDFGQAGNTIKGGVGNHFNIIGETFTNQANNLF